MNRSVLVTLIAATVATAASAEPIDPCSLLSAADKAELGIPADVMPTLERQPGAVQMCRYQLRGTSARTNVVSVIVSADVPDRVLQLRAMIAKALSERSRAQLEARGEYYAGSVMCKVVATSELETSQCLGAAEQTIVAFSLTRPNPENGVKYPEQQLRLEAALVSRASARGG
jgi:hypothetical protein